MLPVPGPHVEKAVLDPVASGLREPQKDSALESPGGLVKTQALLRVGDSVALGWG